MLPSLSAAPEPLKHQSWRCLRCLLQKKNRDWQASNISHLHMPFPHRASGVDLDRLALKRSLTLINVHRLCMMELLVGSWTFYSKGTRGRSVERQTWAEGAGRSIDLTVYHALLPVPLVLSRFFASHMLCPFHFVSHTLLTAISHRPQQCGIRSVGSSLFNSWALPCPIDS